MVDLGYYDTWYHKAPFLHKSAGVLLLAAMVFRVIWRLTTVQPKAINTQSKLVQLAAKSRAFTYVFLALCHYGCRLFNLYRRWRAHRRVRLVFSSRL